MIYFRFLSRQVGWTMLVSVLWSRGIENGLRQFVSQGTSDHIRNNLQYSYSTVAAIQGVPAIRTTHEAVV